nr:hypothetical protein [Tanacetum cinerariifolium]
MESFQGLTPKSPSSWHRSLASNSIFYDHVSVYLKCEINRAVGGKLRDKNADESWKIIENYALYDHEDWYDHKDWNDLSDFVKPVKAISTPQGTPKMPNQRLLELEEGKEEKNNDDNITIGDSIKELDRLDARMPLKEAEKENEAENGTKNEPIKNKGFDVNVMPLSTYKKLTDERPAETDTRLSLASHSHIYSLGITEDVFVDVVGYVYPADFVILIKEDKKRPFILGTPFLTTTKVVIKFDKGTITLRSGKSKMSFHRIPKSLCKIKKGIKNDIEPIAPTMTVNRLVLKWEERIKIHQEKDMEFG